MKKLLFTLLALLITFSSFSQRDPDETYLSAFVYTPKDGMREKFEAAAAKKEDYKVEEVTAYRLVKK